MAPISCCDPFLHVELHPLYREEATPHMLLRKLKKNAEFLIEVNKTGAKLVLLNDYLIL